MAELKQFHPTLKLDIIIVNCLGVCLCGEDGCVPEKIKMLYFKVIVGYVDNMFVVGKVYSPMRDNYVNFIHMCIPFF